MCQRGEGAMGTDRGVFIFGVSRAQTTVLLVSLKAGGVGLNLTAASVVFLVDVSFCLCAMVNYIWASESKFLTSRVWTALVESSNRGPSLRSSPSFRAGT